MTTMPSYRSLEAGALPSLPLAPFLTALAGDGIRTTLRDYARIHLALGTRQRWTIRRLRSVLSALLVQDPEQEALFRRRFKIFFELEAKEQARFSHVDLERALEDLQKLVDASEASQESTDDAQRQDPGRGRRSRPEDPSQRARPRIDETDGRAPRRDRAPDDARSARTDPASGKQPGLTSADASEPENVRAAAAPEPEPRSEKSPSGGPDGSSSDSSNDVSEGSRCFRVGSLGGRPARRLDREALDQLADSLTYFRDAETGNNLAVRRSIEASARSGGQPRLVFKPRRRVRSALILEDLYAEPRDWNPIADELARGLEHRGVSVLLGRFRGVPESFLTPDGFEHALEDLEDDRRGYLLLIFSDGKSLSRPRDSFVLEALSRWPMVAWMELREPRAWDESTARVAQHGLPVYPASRAGLLAVLERVASERGAPRNPPPSPRIWTGRPIGGSGSRLEKHELEYLFGGALSWAQDCSMMIPPVSLGLADGLRRRFHPELPPERIERLLTLPGATYSAAGVRFSGCLLELLRRGFLTRASASRQGQLLRYLIDEIQRAEPEDEDSVEHQAWEWRLERIRLELEPDPALERLSELATGPLGAAIRADLGRLEIAPRPADGTPGIPLRAPPTTARGLELLRTLVVTRRVQEKDESVMLYVPAASYTLGSDEFGDHERPVHRVDLSAFWIAQHPVTNQQYSRFLAANPNREPPAYRDDSTLNKPLQPVVGVDWEDAGAYCRWAGLLLPTEAQWEAAARGTDQCRYPWGDADPTSGHANFDGRVGGTSPVGAYPRGRGPFGTLDQAGNVWEWCADAWDPTAYTGRDGERDPAHRRDDAKVRVLRGGSWDYRSRSLACAYRNMERSHFKPRNVGFRCVRPTD